MTQNGQLLNYVNGGWQKSSTGNYGNVINPATAQVAAQVPLSPGAEVDTAVQAAQKAFPAWRRTPVGDRIQFLFKFKNLLEANLDAIARTIATVSVLKNGKAIRVQAYLDHAEALEAAGLQE